MSFESFVCAVVLLIVGYDCYNTKIFPPLVQQTSCRFAHKFTVQDILDKQSIREQFKSNISFWEGKFNVHGIGYNALSGVTYDGHGIDFNTGLKHDPLHPFSAASKESIHINLLTLALEGNRNALLFFQPTATQDSAMYGTSDVNQVVLKILERKIKSYQDFNNKYPGFGGWLPWFKVDDSGLGLLWDWTSRVPSLDNGQLVWSMIALIDTLERAGQTGLATLYRDHLKLMQKTATIIFYEDSGHIRTVSLINDTTAPVTRQNYQAAPCHSPPCFLDDPYEGELMAFYMDLYADWPLWDRQYEREKIWIYKRDKLQSVDYVTPSGNITVEKGWWYSSHEKWKYLDLPYTSVPINNRIFLNGEKARAWHSALNKIPGMYASVTNVGKSGQYDPGYISACGIQSISFEKVQYRDVVTPYGAFPVILASEPHGLAWYLMMLQGSRMQGPFGSTEASSTDGTMISPVTTWDSKITTVVSILGGVAHINERVLKRDGLFDRFYTIVDTEWSRVFTQIRGENIPFVGPTATIPCVEPCDFTTCTIL